MFDLVSNVEGSRGERIMMVEMRALKTHPAEVREAFDLEGPFELTWSADRGERRIEGRIDPEDPRFTMVFERGKHPDGLWEVTVRARSAGREVQIWRQDVFLQNDLDRSWERIDALARTYAPILVFSKGEEQFPMSLRDLLGHPTLRESGEHVHVKTVFGKEEIPVGRLGEFMRMSGHRECLLDFSFSGMKRSVFTRIGRERERSTVYYSYIEDRERGRFFINYHTFYAFDPKSGLARKTGVGPHVFDRESMVLVFEGEGDPASMVISGHLENQTIFFLDKLRMWTQGRIRMPYAHPSNARVGLHPVVAVAERSHALYPTSGEYSISLLREAAGYFHRTILGLGEGRGRDTGEGISADQILVPQSMSGRSFLPYRLLPLRLDRLSSRIQPDDEEASTSHLVFSGYWVDVPGFENARFPPFTRKESDIEDWVDGAFEWEWDGLPDGIHENNRIILDFIERGRGGSGGAGGAA